MAAVLPVAAAVCLLVAARCAVKQKRPLRALLGSIFGGIGALAAVIVLAPITGVQLQINSFTCFIATVLGLPGVIFMLLLKLLLL